MKLKITSGAILSGMWSLVWHDLLGMENCFMKFYEAPDVIHYCVRKITDFYLKANKKLFELWHNDIDIFFFENDIGSQNDCIISPAMYREFIFSYMKEIVDLVLYVKQSSVSSAIIFISWLVLLARIKKRRKYKIRKKDIEKRLTGVF